MHDTRPKSQIGASTNGVTLPAIDELSYPVQVTQVHVRLGNYVTPDTPIYTLMDRDGETQSYNYGLHGQITKLATNAGDIFTEPQRIFELCCDETAQAYARAQAPAKKKEPTPTPPSAGKTTAREDKHGMRWDLAGALLGTIILAGVVLNANGVFDGRSADMSDPALNDFNVEGAGEASDVDSAHSAPDTQPNRSASNKSGVEPIIIPGSTPGTQRGRQTLENGTYVGDLKDGARHGKGTYTFDSGDKYSGEFENNARTGLGTYEFASGTIYTGNFLEGRFHGEGQIKYSNGARYSGSFKDGERDGVGKITYEGGTYYDGSWTDNDYNGTGELKFSNGAIYSGAFVDGARTGKGTITFTDGGRYEGDFVDGLFQGFGRYDFAAGGNYSGAYKFGKQHGDGVLTLADGGIFKGAFLDGRPQGQGVFTRRTGDVITGTFRGDIGTGTGQIKFADGDSYSGDFKNGELKGKTKFQKRVKFRKPKQPKPYASYQEMMDRERELAEQRYAERRYQRARRDARRAKRSGKSKTSTALLRSGALPNTMYYAALLPNAGDALTIGERIQCANTVESDVTCSVAKIQKLWAVSLACDPRYNSDKGEASDRLRLVAYVAKGNTDRMRDHFIRWNKARYQAAGPRYMPLMKNILGELSKVKMTTKTVGEIRVYYDSYASIAESLKHTGCRTIDLNAGRR